MEQLSQDFNIVSTGDDGKSQLWQQRSNGENQNKSQLVLLSPPGVFGGVETGQVSVLFDDIHLFRRPAQTRGKIKIQR